MPSLSPATGEFGQNKVGHTSVRRALSFSADCGYDNTDMLRNSSQSVFTECWIPEGGQKRDCLVATCDLLGCLLIGPCYCCMFGLLSDWLKWLFLLDCLRVVLQPDNSSDSASILIDCIYLPLAWLICRLRMSQRVRQICVSVAAKISLFFFLHPLRFP